MKLQATQENLSKALQIVSRVANNRGTLPILANVLLKTIDNRLTIAATNLDIAITHYIGAKVSEEGSITVPARLMQEFVSSLPSGVIDVTLEESKLHVTTSEYQSIINGVNAEEFPVMPAIIGGQKWTIAAPVLKKALQQVVTAASNDEARPVLTGVYVHTHEGQLYIAATDSYRLAEKALLKTKIETKLLIPASAMQDVLRILGDIENTVSITHDDQQVLFKMGDVELVTRLIDGNYPDYRKLLPQTFNVTVEVARAELVNIVKVSSLFARESAGSITIHVNSEKQQISIRSVASQLGENTASASAKIEGDGDITLNSRYLLDGLHALSGEKVTIGFNGKLEPCVLKDPALTDYVHLIMPLKS